MGITISARGRIDRLGDIPRLIDEVKGIAAERGWKVTIVDDNFDAQPDATLTRPGEDRPAAVIKGSLGLKGIVLSVDAAAEPLAILFDQSGILTDMLQQLSWLGDNRQGQRFTACKTQFGDIDAHIRIIELLDVLKNKYIHDLAVNDEGGYWEDRDRRLLAEKRAVLEYYLDRCERVIGSVEISGVKDLNPDAVASRVVDALLKAEKDGGSIH